MKPAQTIFNKNTNTVTISVSEYNKLILYKEYCQEIKRIMEE